MIEFEANRWLKEIDVIIDCHRNLKKNKTEKLVGCQ